jgi:hypothetical protein
MHLYIDSVIFEDGLILGPDKSRYYLQIQERYSVVQEFVAEVNTAKNSGEDIHAVAERIRKDAEGKRDTASSKSSSRRAYYAGLLQRSPNAEGAFRQLEQQVKPPSFQHTGGE